jgi:lysophospholipase L1-like esterase
MLQNMSINGNTTRQALERMPYDITSHHPDFLMIQFGMNDCNYWETDHGVPRVSKRAFSANLEEMVDRAVATGTKLVFLNTNHPSLKGSFSHFPSMSYARSNAEYNEVIRATHGELIDRNLPVVLVDIESAWQKHLAAQLDLSLSDLLLPDEIHLSLQGHGLYTDIVVPIIQDSLAGYLQ